MKRYILAAITLSMTALSAGATTDHALPADVQFQIHELSPAADLSNLTNAQYAQFVSLFCNSGQLSAGDNLAGAINAILQGH